MKKKTALWILLAVVVVVALSTMFALRRPGELNPNSPVASEYIETDPACLKLIADEEKFHENAPESQRTRAFVSPRLDTCLKLEIDEGSNDFSIWDIGGGYIPREEQGNAYYGLFSCREDWVYNMILDNVDKVGRDLEKLDKETLADHGESLVPDVGSSPYSLETCKRLFEKKLDELGKPPLMFF